MQVASLNCLCKLDISRIENMWWNMREPSNEEEEDFLCHKFIKNI